MIFTGLPSTSSEREVPLVFSVRFGRTNVSSVGSISIKPPGLKVGFGVTPSVGFWSPWVGVGGLLRSTVAGSTVIVNSWACSFTSFEVCVLTVIVDVSGSSVTGTYLSVANSAALLAAARPGPAARTIESFPVVLASEIGVIYIVRSNDELTSGRLCRWIEF